MAYDFSRIISIEGRLSLVNAGFDRLNQGSLVELLAFPESDILSVPSYSFSFDNNQAATLSGSLVLRNGAEGYRMRFSPGNSSFSETEQENDDGIFWEQSLTIRIPKDRPEVTWLKQRTRHGRYAMLYRDANGIVKFLRNQRVKLDLNTGNDRGGFNGHTLVGRRSSTQPAIHWSVSSGQSITEIYSQANINLDVIFYALPEGWQAGKVLELNHTPFNAHALEVVYNQAVSLRYGEHYVVNGQQLTLLFNDEVQGGEEGTIYCIYGTQTSGAAVGAFAQERVVKSSAYSSGETLVLTNSAIADQQLLIIYNASIVLRPGIDFNISGNTISLLFAGDPGGDQDTFDVFYAIDNGSSLSIMGWQQFPLSISSSQIGRAHV